MEGAPVLSIFLILSMKENDNVHQMSTCCPFINFSIHDIFMMTIIARFEKSCVAPMMKVSVQGY